MTFIEHPYSYGTLPHIFLIQSDWKPKDLGYYDPNWGVETEIEYEPGKFKNEYGEIVYNDSAYEGHQSLVLAFKHMPLGNAPVWRKIGRGHFHIKHLVSKNNIRPYDVMTKTESGDIIIFADLSHYPPMAIVHPNRKQETLYELTPTLSPDELARVSKDLGFITKVKERLMEATEDARDFEAKEFLALTRAVAAEGALIQTQEHLNNLLKNYKIVQEKVIKLQLMTRDKISKGLEIIEGQYNLNMSLEPLQFEDTRKTAEMMQADIHTIGGFMKLNGSLSESQKQTMILQVVNVVGLDYLKHFLLGMDQYQTTTPNGLQNISVSREPTPTELLITYSQMYENGKLTAAERDKMVLNVMDKMKSRIKGNQDDNSAIQSFRDELVQKINPEPNQTAPLAAQYAR